MVTAQYIFDYRDTNGDRQTVTVSAPANDWLAAVEAFFDACPGCTWYWVTRLQHKSVLA